jgi:hypothetical protein
VDNVFWSLGLNSKENRGFSRVVEKNPSFMPLNKSQIEDALIIKGMKEVS